MLSEYDITFCSRNCGNNECERNKKRIYGKNIIVSMSDFKNCKQFKKEENK